MLLFTIPPLESENLTRETSCGHLGSSWPFASRTLMNAFTCEIVLFACL